ncbi:MAG TPA: hypothetical protein VFK05_12175 [Polyangiaceae bacterium]|nr:hypothetical protein [Polyangiaceae bacterium]
MALNTRIGPTAVAAALGLAALASTGAAQAVTCSSVISSKNLTHVIYGSGGSAITATLAKVAYVLSKANPPITVFYQDAGGAQVGYTSFKNGTGGTTARPFKYFLNEADVTGTAPTCTADDATNGGPVDFATTGGTLALFGETLPSDVGVFIGPTQGVNVIVPKDSTETSISTEALYTVYGFGPAAVLTDATNPIPWTKKEYIIQRASTSFVQQLLRGAIQSLGGNASNFPPDFAAAATPTTAHSSSGKDDNQGTVDSLVWAAGQGHAQDAIGFTSGPTADKNRAAVHTLAYQHAGQSAGYWPDSTPDSFDKRNIRNGQYYLWDTNQFFAKITGSNAKAKLSQIVNEDVRNFIGYFSGETFHPDGTDVNRAVAETGSIPLCAMSVKRETDFTGLSCYAPETPCGCFFEAIATGTATCEACTKDSECNGSAPKCHFGFCEAY